MATPAPLVPHDADRALVDGVRAGNASAFEAIFRAYNRDCHRYALRILASADDADDVVQGVFVDIWTHRATWAVRGSLRVYLLGAVRNRALERQRTAARHDRLNGQLLVVGRGPVSEALLPPDAQTRHRDLAVALEAAIAALPPRGREAFVLSREHGLTYEQIGLVMGISPKTVMVHIGRALTALHRALAPFLLVLLAIR